jgi:hypothetical protein
LAEARPLAFKPPLGFLPSFLCHAGLLAIVNLRPVNTAHISINSIYC